MHWRLPEPRDDLRGVVPLPRLLDAALEVPVEGGLPPRTVHGVRDRRKGGAGAVLFRARTHRVQVNRQRAVPAHRVPEDRLAGEVLEE